MLNAEIELSVLDSFIEPCSANSDKWGHICNVKALFWEEELTDRCGAGKIEKFGRDDRIL